MLSLMLPHEVHIQPFSKIASFNEDRIPDGILAVVRPVDPFGDPVKAVGLFYFELWSYRNASGDHKGERLEFWDQMIDNPEDVRRHWKRAQMYEFQLAWTQGAGAVQPGRKYILTVSYRTPWDTTIQDEHVLEFHLPGESLTGIPDGRDAQTRETASDGEDGHGVFTLYTCWDDCATPRPEPPKTRRRPTNKTVRMSSASPQRISTTNPFPYRRNRFRTRRQMGRRTGLKPVVSAA